MLRSYALVQDQSCKFGFTNCNLMYLEVRFLTWTCSALASSAVAEETQAPVSRVTCVRDPAQGRIPKGCLFLSSDCQNSAGNIAQTSISEPKVGQMS